MCAVHEGPKRTMPCDSAWHGFPALRSSAQAPNMHALCTQQNKSPMQKANHTDLHTLEAILVNNLFSLSKPPWRSHIPRHHLINVFCPLSFPSSSTPATLDSFLFLKPLPCGFGVCFLFLVCSSPLPAHPLQFSAQSHLNRKVFPLHLV